MAPARAHTHTHTHTQTHTLPVTGKAVSQRRRQHGPVRAATDDDMSSADVKELANFISAQPMDDAREAI
eukprot:1159637-Pelagomonas_calceolata.AAC.4